MVIKVITATPSGHPKQPEQAFSHSAWPSKAATTRVQALSHLERSSTATKARVLRMASRSKRSIASDYPRFRATTPNTHHNCRLDPAGAISPTRRPHPVLLPCCPYPHTLHSQFTKSSHGGGGGLAYPEGLQRSWQLSNRRSSAADFCFPVVSSAMLQGRAWNTGKPRAILGKTREFWRCSWRVCWSRGAIK